MHFSSAQKRKSFSESFEYDSLRVQKRATAAISSLDRKLIWIPLVFILLRMWGTLRFFISFAASCRCHDVFSNEIGMSESCFRALYTPALMYLQSLGDPGQGWGNALLFVIFNYSVLQRMCPCLLTWWACVQLQFKQWGSMLPHPQPERDRLIPASTTSSAQPSDHSVRYTTLIAGTAVQASSS